MSQEKQVLENNIRQLQSRITQLIAERNEYKALYVSVSERHWDALQWSDGLQRLLDKYQAWFTYHKNWTDHHNRMIQWNPKLGYPDIPGGDPETPDLDEMSGEISPVATGGVEE